MKKIGFVDYYLSEWHANNYPAWIKLANEKLGTDYELGYAWAELNVSPLDGVTTEQWCETFGAEKCETIEELCEKSDVIMILAPSDPETHLAYCEAVFPCGKPTYVDKTFAPDYETAAKIFDIAKKYNTPFFSTSALRYAEEFKELRGLSNAVITGGGGNFHEYMIHPIEIFVSLFSEKVSRVRVEAMGTHRLCSLKTVGGTEAMIIYSPAYIYTVTAQMSEGMFCKKEATADFFVNLTEKIIGFFKTGRHPFDPAETLEVMRVRDALLEAEKNDGVWMEI